MSAVRNDAKRERTVLLMHCRTSAITGLLAAAAIAALSLLPTLPCRAQDSDPVLAPQNPAFEAFLSQAHLSSVTSRPSGLIPEPFQIPNPQVGPIRAMDVVSLPTSYDLRPLSKLTPIRDQGQCGSCWDFAATGSLESSLMPAEAWNFSENNLKNYAGFDYGCCSGGNRAMSTAYFARWSGPVAETDDPYQAGSCTSPSGLSPRKHVQDVIFLPNRTSALDNDAIKQAVMTYGAVYTTYYHSNSYYRSSTAAYYDYSSSQANHAVCIVGWDDNYPAGNFLSTPPGNGAFLIRNSWGTYWGMSGYFWMSYYDAVMGRTENAVYTAEPTTNYDQIYQYDPLGWVSSTGYGTNTASFANVFTATTDCSVAAAAWFFPAAGASYTLSVYVDPTSGPIDSTGPLSMASGTMATAGYHTVQLASTVPVTAGHRFSVVVKLTTPGYSYPICVERPYSGYSSKATASTGQSYMSSSGTSWTDVAGYYANTNVCLKAFTMGSTNPTPGPGSLSVSPTSDLTSSGVAGGPFSPSSQAYTLSNPGQSSINWTARASQPWTSLSSTSGAIAAGASVTVTASINANANALAVGAYAGSVSFMNATNGTGNTTRNVSLNVNSVPTPTPGALSVSSTTALAVTGPVGGPFSPTSRTFTLTNTGESAITWTASDTNSWLDLSAATGTLAAGASATVTATVNSTASTLAAGTYSGAISFVNATNGAGNASVAASLTVSAVAPPPSPSGPYQVVPTTYSWIDPTYHQQIFLSDDSISAAYYMLFAFTFYGKQYSRLYVGSNGLFGFTSSGMYLYTNGPIPSTYWPNLAIYPYWENLNPAAGGSVRIATTGTAPNRKIVISWVNVPSKYLTSVTYTFQAILCEGSNDIVFQYQDVAPTNFTYGAGAGATIGIENETGTQGCQFSYNSRSLSNGMAIRFTNQPPGVVGAENGGAGDNRKVKRMKTVR